MAFALVQRQEALRRAEEIEKEEIFVIGGAKIFAQFLPHADRLYLTIVQGTYDVDTYFPDYSAYTKLVEREEGEENGLRFRFETREKE